MNVSKPISSFIVKNKSIQKAFEFTDKNPGLVTGIIDFAISTTIKPATMMVLPSNKEDSKYIASKCIADGFVDLVFSYAIFTPLSKAIDFANKKLIQSKYFANKKSLNTLYNRGGRIILTPLKILLTLATVPKVVELVNENIGKRNISKCKNKAISKSSKLNIKA